MTLIKYNPRFTGAEDRTFSSFIDKFFNDSLRNVQSELTSFNPQADIAETKKEFEIELAVPGMKKQDFKIDIENDRLIISGERKQVEKTDDKNYHSVETYYGNFSKTFYLPENIKEDKIEASYQDGILKIVIPKDEKKELVKTIQIK